MAGNIVGRGDTLAPASSRPLRHLIALEATRPFIFMVLCLRSFTPCSPPFSETPHLWKGIGTSCLTDEEEEQVLWVNLAG